MTVTLSLAAFVALFFPMLAIGIGLGIWCRHMPASPPKQDLHATVETRRDPAIDREIDRLIATCKMTVADGQTALFEQARKRKP